MPAQYTPLRPRRRTGTNGLARTPVACILKSVVRQSRRSVVAWAALVLLAGAVPALTQQAGGNLYGRVTDETGQGLPGVTVTLSGQGPDQVQVTNAQGDFRFLNLPPGTRRLKAEMDGFTPIDYPDVGIGSGRNTTLAVTMVPADVPEELVVTAEPPGLDAADRRTARSLQSEIEALPVRRIQDFVELTPGVVIDETDAPKLGLSYKYLDWSLRAGLAFDTNLRLDDGTQGTRRTLDPNDDEVGLTPAGSERLRNRWRRQGYSRYYDWDVPVPAAPAGDRLGIQFDTWDRPSGDTATRGAPATPPVANGSSAWNRPGPTSPWRLDDTPVFNGASPGFVRADPWSLNDAPVVPPLELDGGFMVSFDSGTPPVRSASGSTWPTDPLPVLPPPTDATDEAWTIPGRAVPAGPSTPAPPDIRHIPAPANPPSGNLFAPARGYELKLGSGQTSARIQDTVGAGTSAGPSQPTSVTAGPHVALIDAIRNDQYSTGGRTFGSTGSAPPQPILGAETAWVQPRDPVVLPQIDGALALAGNPNVVLVPEVEPFGPLDAPNPTAGLPSGYSFSADAGTILNTPPPVGSPPDQPEITAGLPVDTDPFAMLNGLPNNLYLGGPSGPTPLSVDGSPVDDRWQLFVTVRVRLVKQNARALPPRPAVERADGAAAVPGWLARVARGARGALWTLLQRPPVSASLAPGRPVRLPAPGTLVRLAPSSAQAAASRPAVSIVSSGLSSGDAFELQVLDPDGESADVLAPDGLVLQAVRQGAGRALRSAASDAVRRVTMTGFCLEFHKPPPPVDTIYQVASPQLQQRYAPIRAVLRAGTALADAGRFHPDSDPAAYATSIRQWSLWTRLEDWDLGEFTREFVDYTRRNVEANGARWTDQIRDVVRAAAPNRFTDITAVLEEADRLAAGR